MVVDGLGDLVWFRPVRTGLIARNLMVQSYRGEPVLTWWEGNDSGSGEGVIIDSSYREIARIRAGNGRKVDSHELLLTPEGTALITCTPVTVAADLSSVGGSDHGQVSESIMQEVDVRSGRVLMEWRSLEHIAIDESHMFPGGVYDYLHLNSIDVTPDGNLLVSARHTWALYKIDRGTGAVMWRLGGKRSDFAIGAGAEFAWQHDARHLGNGQISLFNDGAAFFFSGPHAWRKTQSESRGLVLELDAAARSVRLARAYRHRPPLLAASEGSMRTLPAGDVVVDWGGLPVVSQYTERGGLRQELRMPLGYSTYRAFRQPWRGTPDSVPAIAARRHHAGTRHHTRRTTLYVSWNGDTETHAWRVDAGPRPSALRPKKTVGRRGFETAIPAHDVRGYARVTALDGRGTVMASSRIIRL
jgi:hypothetical protein